MRLRIPVRIGTPTRGRIVNLLQDAVLLSAGDSTLTLIPALGGKIASLHLAGREWLWKSDVIPYRVPDDAMRADDASYVRSADTGGYDECFPTVGACILPPDVPQFGGLRLPDHGELWSQEPAVKVERDRNGDRATLTWTGRRMPYLFNREVRVEDTGRVTMAYQATNRGGAPLPFLWSAHPLLPLTEHTRLHLPRDARMRVDAAHSLDVEIGSGHAWPVLMAGELQANMSRPATLDRSFACKLFLDLPAGPIVAALEEEDAKLEVAFDGSAVTHFGLWINNRGWTPFEGGRPYRNLGFEPCIGAPDSLAKALGEWDGAAWLAPGETREWTLTWSATRA